MLGMFNSGNVVGRFEIPPVLPPGRVAGRLPPIDGMLGRVLGNMLPEGRLNCGIDGRCDIAGREPPPYPPPIEGRLICGRFTCGREPEKLGMLVGRDTPPPPPPREKLPPPPPPRGIPPPPPRDMPPPP
jgi:hypothetical protein